MDNGLNLDNCKRQGFLKLAVPSSQLKQSMTLHTAPSPTTTRHIQILALANQQLMGVWYRRKASSQAQEEARTAYTAEQGAFYDVAERCVLVSNDEPAAAIIAALRPGSRARAVPGQSRPESTHSRCTFAPSAGTAGYPTGATEAVRTTEGAAVV